MKSHKTIDECDELFNKAGGVESREKDDLGLMHGRSLEDLDGHI